MKNSLEEWKKRAEYKARIDYYYCYDFATSGHVLIQLNMISFCLPYFDFDLSSGFKTSGK